MRADGDDQGQAGERDHGARDHLFREHAQARRAVAAGAGRGRLPFEQPVLRDRETHERHRDRVQHLIGLIREKYQLQEDPGEIRVDVFDRGAQKRRSRLQSCGPAQQVEEPQTHGQPDRGETDRRPGDRRAGQDGPAKEEGGNRRRRHEAPAQVVEDLPARHERQAIALQARTRRHERKEPPQNLPVAAHPAVLASGVREDARRIVVDDLDIGDERRTRIEALEEVVRQQGVLRHASFERGRERIDVVEALAGEDALVEEILVHVGDGRGVRVHAGMAGVRPREQRSGRAGHRDADSRLQNPVAFHDAADARVEARAIQRMRDDADELLGDIARQAGVRVERDAIAHRRENVQFADLYAEARVEGAPEQPVEFLDLSALALPPHPDVFLGVPAPRAMKQEEAIRMVRTEPPVEGFDARLRGVENRLILGELAGVGVGEIAEDGEMDAGIEVAQREHLDVLEERRHRRRARQHRGHDHHRPRIVRNVIGEVEPRQAARRDDPRDRLLRERNRDVGRRNEQEEREHRQRGCGGARAPGVGRTAGQQPGRHHRDRSQVGERRVFEQEAFGPAREAWPMGDVDLEVAPSRVDEVIAHVGRAIGG